MTQLNDYKCFINASIYNHDPIPEGYKKIRVHLVYDVKHDGCHKACLINDWHVTNISLESVFSGVVSLCGLQMVTFLAELNGMDLWAADIGKTYLEAYTAENLVIIGRPKFREMEGHILIISKVMYGLQTSGLCWHDHFSECLCKMGFTPPKAKPNIWMWHDCDYYEIIAVYVNNLAITSKDPKGITDMLTGTYGFKLKGMSPIDYHLACLLLETNMDSCVTPLRGRAMKS